MSDVANELHCYLVGGAVRDALLGRPVGDKDWVVVGSTPEQMLELGFTQVGRDFPVFLHPDHHQEFALARTERKQGSGHTGFSVHASPDVTLEEDLKRRDLTINAIAQSVDGQIIDPFGGVADLQAKNLRHVSAAFAEDPLRVMRVARLAAQLPDFTVDADTNALMARMCASGELQTLSAERVWQEFEKALDAPAPLRFFEVLTECGGMADWFIELDGITPAFATADARSRFAELPLNRAGFETLSARIRVPRLYLQSALDALAHADLLLHWRTVAPDQLVDALGDLKAMHDAQRLRWLLAWLSERGAGPDDEGALLAIVAQLRQVRLAEPVPAGRAYGKALRRERIALIESQRAR